MKAAQFIGKPMFEIGSVDTPKCPPGGLLVRVEAVAICGTDLKVLSCQDVKIEKGGQSSMTLPRITGHELSGVIAEVGDGAGGFEVGRPVVVAATIPCLKCPICERGHHEMCLDLAVIGYHRDGGFAEMIRVDPDVIAADCVVGIPDNVSFDAAALTEPLSCAVNCLELSPVAEGSTVLVLGAGPLGAIIANLARSRRAGRVILADVFAEQLDKAAHIVDLDAVIDLSQDDLGEGIDEITGGLGADLVVCACSAPPAQLAALDVVARRGAVNFFGGLPRDNSVVQMDTNLIHYKEIAVIGTHGSAPRHVRQAVQLQAAGDIDLGKYVDRTLPLDEINDGVKAAKGHGRMKIVIRPNG